MNETLTAIALSQGGTTAVTLPIDDKKSFARRWRFSVRTVDAFLAQGMPHLKIGSRRVRIDTEAADKWMHERFGVRRRSVRRCHRDDFSPETTNPANQEVQE